MDREGKLLARSFAKDEEAERGPAWPQALALETLRAGAAREKRRTERRDAAARAIACAAGLALIAAAGLPSPASERHREIGRAFAHAELGSRIREGLAGMNAALSAYGESLRAGNQGGRR